MARAPSLPKQFPDADFVVKAKFWTPKRNTVEISGPYEHDQAFLAMMLLSKVGGLSRRERKLAKELLGLLAPTKKGAGTELSSRSSASRRARAG